MEMVRLLTLRAIILPDTIIKYFTWLSDGKNSNNNPLNYSLSFQQQVNKFCQNNNSLLIIKVQIQKGINLIIDELELDKQDKIIHLQLLKEFILDKNSLWQTSCINAQKLFSKKNNKWFNFPSIYKDEFDKIYCQNLVILGFRSAYLPEYVPILSYLYKKFNDTNIKLFPENEEAKDIRRVVKYLFLEGLLEQPLFWVDVWEYPYYCFRLKKNKSNAEAYVNIRTFMPEFLEALGDKEEIDNWCCKEHLDELALDYVSLVFLFNGLIDDQDSKISQSVNYLKNYLSNYRDNLIRIPIIFHHFDHPELYPYKDDMDSFLKQKFPLTKKAFDDWGKESKIAIRYFPCSLFGVVNNNGKIESNGIYDDNNKHYAILKNPDHWKPFNVLSPIYWLLTGRYDPNFLDI